MILSINFWMDTSSSNDTFSINLFFFLILFLCFIPSLCTSLPRGYFWNPRFHSIPPQIHPMKGMMLMTGTIIYCNYRMHISSTHLHPQIFPNRLPDIICFLGIAERFKVSIIFKPVFLYVFRSCSQNLYSIFNFFWCILRRVVSFQNDVIRIAIRESNGSCLFNSPDAVLCLIFS